MMVKFRTRNGSVRFSGTCPAARRSGPALAIRYDAGHATSGRAPRALRGTVAGWRLLGDEGFEAEDLAVQPREGGDELLLRLRTRRGVE